MTNASAAQPGRQDPLGDPAEPAGHTSSMIPVTVSFRFHANF